MGNGYNPRQLHQSLLQALVAMLIHHRNISLQQERLKAMGEWMKYNSRAIYGCTQAPESFEVPANSLLTYNPETNRLYIHLLDYPLQNFTLKGYKGKVKYAQFLHDASEIQITEPRGHWVNQELAQNDINLNLTYNGG